MTAAALTLLTTSASACGGKNPNDMSGMDRETTGSPSTNPMPGMSLGDMLSGDGLSASASGLTFTPVGTTMPAGTPATFAFQIRTDGGEPITTFAEDQTKLMHLYLVRSDLTGFQHLHPTIDRQGNWSASVGALEPGSWRAYVLFIADVGSIQVNPLVLSVPVTVPGDAALRPLPPAATSTAVDGYALTVSGAELMANMTHTLTVTISRSGHPVRDLQPYLATYAHLTAFHEGNLALAHLHPEGVVHGDHGGPTLTFEARLPNAGNWRLFVQFKTGNRVHMAALTLGVS